MDVNAITEEQKTEILNRADEIGVKNAAEEYEISWQKIASWKRRAAAADQATEKKENEETPRKGRKKKEEIKQSEPNLSKIELENAALKTENAFLKVQVEKLKKALQELA